jgi:hypothetical protein
MVVMPNPVELLSGEMKSPSDCLAPIVAMRMAAAATVITHAPRLRAPVTCDRTASHYFRTTTLAQAGPQHNAVSASAALIMQEKVYVARRTDTRVFHTAHCED